MHWLGEITRAPPLAFFVFGFQLGGGALCPTATFTFYPDITCTKARFAVIRLTSRLTATTGRVTTSSGGMRLRAQAHDRGPAAVREIARRLLPRIADTRNLALAWEHLRQHGGEAPGPDRRTYHDYGEREVWPLLRSLSDQIQRGTYRPGPDRRVEIPKSSGDQVRVLSLPNVCDRVVQRATLQMVQPLLDPGFAALSFGCRPGRGVQDALAHAEIRITREGHTVPVVDDIGQAFDRVPIGRLLDVVSNRLPDDALSLFVETLVQQEDSKGLRQGSPLSPLLLNLYLDHFLDTRWRRMHPDVPLIRYVDDVLLLCRPEHDVEGLYDEFAQLLVASGLPLKGSRTASIHDLAVGADVRWLGFQMHLGALGLELRLPSDNGNPIWATTLAESLALAHEKTHSPQRAQQAIEGLLDSIGPAYPFMDRHEFCGRLTAIAEQFSFEERPLPKEVARRWRRAYRRWCERRMTIFRASDVAAQKQITAA